MTTRILFTLTLASCAGAARAPAPAPAPASDPTAGPAPARGAHPHDGAARGGGDGAPTAELRALLAAHNAKRAEHCAPPLAWSAKLAAVAQRWADHLRDAGCAFEHSRTEYGENLAAGSDGALDPAGVVGMWYGEIARYDFRRGGFSMETGHFTQLVWKDSRALGCGTSRCNGMTIWVCNYDPPGNVEGEYRENVAPRSCR